MKKKYLLYPFLLFCFLTFDLSAQQVELKNDFFYIDGKKFFVKGIGYEAGALPGEVPWAKEFNPSQLQFDIQKIQSAGFNTIRTWAPFTEQELNTLDAFEIKIIMGIWIDPHGNFSNPTFVNEAKAIVSNVLNYSKNHPNIIGYLIMNEPLPATIFAEGYENTTDLWSELINIIHQNHPGRPVSIANTCNGTYISPKLFDYSAYNVYIYNPVTVNYLHKYKDFVHYLKQLNVPGHPLIISEYGLSVSPTGEGLWGYGGNSLDEQKEGIIHMYKSLVDGGATGSCVFNYSDGWWKGGNEFVHDNTAEEWFGLVEYSNINDTHGHSRPAWDAIKNFQSAIITEPKSAEIYTNKVPVELFLNDTIDNIEISFDDMIIYQNQVQNHYILDTIFFEFDELKDVDLVFNCYDHNNSLVKTELKNILIAPNNLELPNIQITVNDNFWDNGLIDVSYHITKSEFFETNEDLDYIYYPHVGFNYGVKFQIPMPLENEFDVSDSYFINTDVDVLTIGAAFDISYNNFSKRIFKQATYARNIEVVNNVNSSTNQIPEIEIFPTPSRSYFSVNLTASSFEKSFTYSIFNSIGMPLSVNNKADFMEPISIQNFVPGLYYITILHESSPVSAIKKLIIL